MYSGVHSPAEIWLVKHLSRRSGEWYLEDTQIICLWLDLLFFGFVVPTFWFKLFGCHMENLLPPV